MNEYQDILDNLSRLSTICGMNQRYAQHMMTGSQTTSIMIDVCVVVSTMLALALGAAAYVKSEATIPVAFYRWAKIWRCYRMSVDRMSLIFSIAAAVAGVALVVSPASKNAHHYASMLQAWSDLRQDVDSVIVDTEAQHNPSESKELTYPGRRYRDLLAKKNELNSREPAPNQELLDKFLALEERSRGVVGDPSDEVKDKEQTTSVRTADSL